MLFIEIYIVHIQYSYRQIGLTKTRNATQLPLRLHLYPPYGNESVVSQMVGKRCCSLPTMGRDKKPHGDFHKWWYPKSSI